MNVKQAFAGILIGTLLFTGGSGWVDPESAVAQTRSDDGRAVGEAITAFGFELLNEVTDGGDNVVTSPLSVTTMLAMVLAGADGDTAEAMARVLHLDHNRDVRVGELLRQVTDPDDATLSIANGLWADYRIPFYPEYLSFVRDNFDATVETADLGAQQTADEIDAWVADHTQGLIEEMAADLNLPNPEAALVLMNAVYFFGEWTTEFDPAVTQYRPFTLADGVQTRVPTMHQYQEKFGYADRDGFRMLRLPYGESGRYGMEILLPDQPDGLPDLLAGLDAAQWRAAVDSLASTSIEVLALPRFELEWQAELVGTLTQLGMGPVFWPSADLSLMSPVDLLLDTVVHKTYLRVNEEGTEAAGATGGVAAPSAPLDPLMFRVDRPFAFTISDAETGTVLFLGAVADPRG